LIVVEDLWLAASYEFPLLSIKAELRVKADRELSSEHIPGEEIHDRHQVETPFLH